MEARKSPRPPSFTCQARARAQSPRHYEYSYQYRYVYTRIVLVPVARRRSTAARKLPAHDYRTGRPGGAGTVSASPPRPIPQVPGPGDRLLRSGDRHRRRRLASVCKASQAWERRVTLACKKSPQVCSVGDAVQPVPDILQTALRRNT